MAFDDAALERALRAETKRGLTLYCNGETLTASGCTAAATARARTRTARRP